MKIRCVVAYGVQENDIIDRKEAFWKYLDEDVQQADISGSGFILQFDGNLWAGNGIIPGDPKKGSHQKKKKLRNFGHCPKLRDPPPPRLVWTYKVWTLSLGADPPPLYTCPYLSSVKSLAAALTPPLFGQCPKFRSFFFLMASLRYA